MFVVSLQLMQLKTMLLQINYYSYLSSVMSCCSLYRSGASTTGTLSRGKSWRIVRTNVSMASLLTPTSSWGLSRRWERRRCRTSMATSARPPSRPELKSECVCKRVNVCVCVCVCERERDRERERVCVYAWLSWHLHYSYMYMTVQKIIFKHILASWTYKCTNVQIYLNKIEPVLVVRSWGAGMLKGGKKPWEAQRMHSKFAILWYYGETTIDTQMNTTDHSL